jgi:O-antigen/teichoic acid export membrane protein
MTERRGSRSAVLLLAATAVAGLAGYLVTWIVAALAAPEDYAWFATFWSTLFLVVGALAGVQQEVTRASSSRSPAAGGARFPAFVGVAALAAAVALLVTAPLWSGLIGSEPAVVAAMIGGCAAYCVVAGVAGALYGARAWVPIATLVAVDGVLRLGGVALALALAGPEDRGALAVAVVAPFPLALVLVMPFAVGRLRGVRADVGLSRLTGNTVVAVLAAAASAALISGFPALVAAATPDLTPAALAPILLALMLTRAPIVIPAMALQSLLVVRFREATRATPVLSAVAVVLAGTAVLAVLAAVVGPALLEAFFGRGYETDGAVLAILVGSSGIIAAVVVGGAGLLAASRHGVYVASWAAAAVVTVAALALPLDALPRILTAALAGPTVGLVLQVVALLLRRRQVTP